jgi:hypothetical protein
METKDFTTQESLTLINEMIDRARHNVQKGAANSMVFWGWAVAIVSLVNFGLLLFLPAELKNYSFNAWWLMTPAWIINFFLERRKEREVMVKTKIDSIISATWLGYLISVIVLLIVIFTLSWLFDTWKICTAISSVIFLLLGVCQFITAKATNFKPFFWGAVIFWIGALACVACYALKIGAFQFVIMAVGTITGFVIPGVLLNKKAHDNV